MTSRPASILLMSVLMVSAFTLLLVLALSELQISHSYVVLNDRESTRSLYAAEACLEDAVYRYESDSTFVGGSIAIDDQTVCTSAISGTEVTVEVTDGLYSATYVASLEVDTVNLVNNLHLIQWIEN